jgi:uncharacterized protein
VTGRPRRPTASGAGTKREALVRRVLADCFCRLQPSPIAGIGVFAIRPIPRGTNPFQLMPRYARPGYVRLTEEERAALPPGLADLLHALFLPEADGTTWLPTSGTNIIWLNHYLNHSTRPNMRTQDGFTFTAIRAIRVGEELTVDYRTYDAMSVLAPRQGSRLSPSASRRSR